MSKTTHTPGPWQAKKEYGKLSIETKDGREVISLMAQRYHDTEATAARLEADIRLMAAAPEMLELLLAQREILDNAFSALREHHNHVLVSMDKLDLDALNRVIAHAKGERQ